MNKIKKNCWLRNVSLAFEYAFLLGAFASLGVMAGNTSGSFPGTQGLESSVHHCGGELSVVQVRRGL